MTELERRKEWYNKHKEVMRQYYEEGVEVESKGFAGRWVECDDPAWTVGAQYRVKQPEPAIYIYASPTTYSDNSVYWVLSALIIYNEISREYKEYRSDDGRILFKSLDSAMECKSVFFEQIKNELKQ